MATAVAGTDRRYFARPTAKTGWWAWMTTVDHKKIGILYGYTAFAFFIIGGIEALIMRSQLATPDGEVVSAAVYNQLFTMHGLTMIFLVVMPMGTALINFMLPLLIGARDVAFPRMNAFSYWVFLLGGLFLYSSFILGGAADGGWFGYAPLNRELPGNGMTYYSLGLQILGIASLAGAVNFIVTILNMRAPGMTFMRMPVFVWMTLVVSFLLLFALPVIGVALWELMFDRLFGTSFFDPGAGGDPLLWQHLFWLFGHPEVYIMILPAMGIVSEVLPTFARKPLFGYPAIVFAGAAIAFMGWGVWAHHMFAAGLGPVANSAFALSTMLIAVPTGVKIFNWIGTIWGGAVRLTTSFLFAVGFVSMFIIGGLSGVTHSIVPHDAQQTDTYYVVGHLHYVLFGGSIFGIFAGLYYWWPKIFGRLLNERIGKVHFWLMIIGFNLTFGPFHVLGLLGMQRRVYRYAPGLGFDVWNLVATIGAFTIALSIVVFLANAIMTIKRGERAGADPWDARTLEWMVPSPPPEHNFDLVPVVSHRDDWWHRKYITDPKGTPAPVIAGGADAGEMPAEERDNATASEDEQAHGIHLPSPSYYPLVTAVGLPIAGYGVIYQPLLVAVGFLIVLVGA
ncbi:MAG: cytochrome c oxidase subunit I, partial [Actinobacteria bacterium]|nr:cytochrome c oxidase subunit I [Actinomycetota bacterium]